MSDLIYKCAKTYQDLSQKEYEFQMVTDTEIRSFILSFSINDFMHLTGVHKLTDLNIHNMSATTFFNDVLNKKITDSLLRSSSHINDTLNSFSPNGLQYCLNDRLKELIDLPNYILSIDKSTKLLQWSQPNNAILRPNHSEINADLLMLFPTRETSNKKIDTQTTAIFLSLPASENGSNEKKVHLITMFPTDLKYEYNEQTKKPLKSYCLLSLREINLNNRSIRTIFDCTNSELQAAKSNIDHNVNLSMIKKDLGSLKNKRKEYVQQPTGKKKKSYLSKLDNIIKSIKSGLYSTNMIVEFLERLIDQRNDSSNQQLLPYINDEITKVKGVAEQRGIDTSIFKAQINSNGTVSLKSSRVSAISNLINNIKKTVNTFLSNMIKPPEKNNRKNSVHSSKGNSKTKSQSKRSGAKKPVAGKPQNRNRTAAEQSCEKPEQVSRTGSIFGPEQITKNAAKISEKHDKSRSADKSKGRNNPDR